MDRLLLEDNDIPLSRNSACKSFVCVERCFLIGEFPRDQDASSILTPLKTEGNVAQSTLGKTPDTGGELPFAKFKQKPLVCNRRSDSDFSLHL